MIDVSDVLLFVDILLNDDELDELQFQLIDINVDGIPDILDIILLIGILLN